MEIHEYLEQKAKFEQQIREEGTKMLVPLFKETIGDASEILGVKWKQFTPAWNDGDPCTFGLGEPDFFINAAPPNELKCRKYDCQFMFQRDSRAKFCPDCGKERPEFPEEVVLDRYACERQYPHLKDRISKFEKLYYKLESVLEKVFGDPTEIWVYHNLDTGELEWEIEEIEVPY
jgi:hypothetical protein